MLFLTSIGLLLLAHFGTAQQNSDSEDSLPIRLPPAVTRGESAGVCPSVDAIERATQEAIRSVLQDTVVPLIDQCRCDDPGPWRKIAYLDMSDPNQQCPSNLHLITTPVRACGRTATTTNSCESVLFPSDGSSYSHVCGRVNAIQRGNPNAFISSILHARGLNDAYLSGISLTHGAAGSRQHIWSFVGALYETLDDSQSPYPYNSPSVCPCTNTEREWPHQIPSFVGANYFCDAANPGPDFTLTSMFYTDNPLWDGVGCGPTSTCCQFNNPPWFCTTLPQPTTDDLEVRICGHHAVDNEDFLVQLVDISVM